MAELADGLYRIMFTPEQPLSGHQEPGAPLMLLPEGQAPCQEWQVRSTANGNHTISADGLHVSFDGAPDMHEMALTLPEPREWKLMPGGEPGTFIIGVPKAPMRLGMSLLRIWPPRVALAPEYGDQYQAWTFKSVG